MTAIGASRPLRRLPTMVSFLSPSRHSAATKGTGVRAPKPTIPTRREQTFGMLRLLYCSRHRCRRDAASVLQFQGCAKSFEDLSRSRQVVATLGEPALRDRNAPQGTSRPAGPKCKTAALGDGDRPLRSTPRLDDVAELQPRLGKLGGK